MHYIVIIWQMFSFQTYDKKHRPYSIEAYHLQHQKKGKQQVAFF